MSHNTDTAVKVLKEKIEGLRAQLRTAENELEREQAWSNHLKRRLAKVEKTLKAVKNVLIDENNGVDVEDALELIEKLHLPETCPTCGEEKKP
jgi:peptidoglycan hydrolase CwlO-like protein